MATVNIDRDKYVIIGEENEGRYEEHFGQVQDFTPDGHGNYWIKILMSINIGDRVMVDRIKQYNSSALGSIPKLEVFETEAGEQLFSRFKEMVESYQVQASGARLGRPTRRPTVAEQVQDASEGRPMDADRTVGHHEEPVPDVEEDMSIEDRGGNMEPTLIYNDEADIEVEMEAISLNLEAGDMKTILKIAEENPAKVLNVIDRAVQENGHIVFQYLPQTMQQAFIDLKIARLEKFSSIKIEKNKIYEVKEIGTDNSSYMMFIGAGMWIIPEGTNSIEKFTNTFMRFDPTLLGEYAMKQVTDETIIASITDNCRNIMSDVYEGLLEEAVCSEQEPTIEVHLEESLGTISKDTLGEEWVAAITYYYFTGGSLTWGTLDYATFDTYESIKELAISKNDETVLGLLQAA